MSHHHERLEEVKTTLNRLKKDNKKTKEDEHRKRLQGLILEVPYDREKMMMGSPGALGYIGPAGISLAKGLIQKFKGSFRTGAKELAKDQAIGAGLDFFNR